ncbi:MAG: pyridoxamine 5'-phosphate oxidase family protein [Chloroflexia bacterium]
MSQLPEPFLEWLYRGRARLIQRQAAGEPIPRNEMLLGFTRHSPAVVTCGPAGLNASIKGIGFVPKAEYLEEMIAAYLAHIERGWHPGYAQEGLQLLSDLLYSPGAEERLDFSRLGTLELARGHTYANLRADPRVTLLFFEPPALSFEVRGRAEIHGEGSPYHRLLNAQHDVFHRPHPERWPERPAYVFTIEEIYDNSATEEGFGRQIYGTR